MSDTILLLILLIVLALFIKKYYEYKKVQTRFKNVIYIDSEVAKQKEKLEETKQNVEKLNTRYKENLDIYNKLLNEKNILEEDLGLMSYGLYKPHFDFDTSEKYKGKMNENYKKQKELTKNKKAMICDTKWTVDGSKTEGQKMTEKNIRLMSRAFNNECDAAILKTRWNNIDKMEKRIQKAFESINKLGESNRIKITDDYSKLKLEELYLTHEYQQKLQAEKDEQRRIQEQMREEQKVQKELEDVQEEAEREEEYYEKALVNIKKEMEKANQEELIKYQKKISTLEEQLKRAQEKKERAISQAQLTKSGHIYIISNIGSFGEDIYKIGMTRRLDPNDRINELGGASVPFKFDTHAIIYSDNAPELENKIQTCLYDKSVNLANTRKEFFKVKLEEIKKIVEENHGQIELIDIPEAEEYRESITIREQIKNGTYITKIPEKNIDFPDKLYGDEDILQFPHVEK